MGFRIDPATIAKTFSAFMAGLVLVLGGALIYSRAQEPIHPLEVAPAVEAAPVAAPAPPAVEDENVPVPAPEPIHKGRPVRRSQPHPRTYWITRIRTSAPVPAMRVADVRGASLNSPSVTDQPSSQRANPAPEQSIAKASNPILQTQPQPDPQYAPAPAAPPLQPHVVTLLPETSLVVRLGETLSSDHNSSGDAFRGTLDLPIIANGFIIADRGSVILGRVNYAGEARLSGGSAYLILTLTEINTADGQLVRVETRPWEQNGPDMKIRNAPKVFFGAAAGAIEGALSRASQGVGLGDAFGTSSETSTAKERALVLPVDTRIPFRLARPLTITERLNGR